VGPPTATDARVVHFQHREDGVGADQLLVPVFHSHDVLNVGGGCSSGPKKTRINLTVERIRMTLVESFSNRRAVQRQPPRGAEERSQDPKSGAQTGDRRRSRGQPRLFREREGVGGVRVTIELLLGPRDDGGRCPVAPPDLVV